ncbi:MAG: transposase [Aestuariivirga sp.]|nr:transposase [Aestuariivirga sp.]
MKASPLRAFFTLRPERQLMEQVYDNLLYRWFAGLSADAAVWGATRFSRNRERLMQARTVPASRRRLMGHVPGAGFDLERRAVMQSRGLFPPPCGEELRVGVPGLRSLRIGLLGPPPLPLPPCGRAIAYGLER